MRQHQLIVLHQSVNSRVLDLERLKGFQQVIIVSNLLDQSYIFKCKTIKFFNIHSFISDGQVFSQTITEWEEKFGVLRKEYEIERLQRKNLTKILLEMSKDMKLLLSQQKKNDSIVV